MAEDTTRNRMVDDPIPGICVMPWINLHVSTEGRIAPCCEFDGTLGEVANTTLARAWQGDGLHEIRRQFAAGEPVGACWKCRDLEASEGASLRTQKNEHFASWFERLRHASDAMGAGPEYPVAMDLRFSNICNFRCRSCWHGSSSHWFKDGKAIGVTAGDHAEIRSFKTVADAVGQLGAGIETLEELYFAGGEPLLMAEHYALLKLLTERDQTDVALSYSTNMSVTGLGDDSVFDLWARFANLQVRVSVDAAAERGSLVRKGFDWPRFVTHVRELRERCPHAIVSFGITVSALNIISLTDLCRALTSQCSATPAEFQFHSLQEPEFYRTQVLPPRLKRVATRRIARYVRKALSGSASHRPGVAGLARGLTGIAAYMNAADLTGRLPQFEYMMRRLDELRSEDSVSTLPELRKVLQKKRGWRDRLTALRSRLA